MPKPKASLDALTVPKAPAAPHGVEGGSAPSPAAPAGKGYAHTLSLRLTAEQYRRLRRHVHDQEERTGARRTHQSVIEAALTEYLDRQGA